jgi:Na+/H+-dicarboxylate symporter
MSSKTTVLLLLGMIAGLALGALLGQLVPEVMLALAFVGKLFMNSLTVLVIGLVVTSMVIGITSLGDYRKLGYASGKALVYYLTTGLFAVITGLITVFLMRPGEGYFIPGVTRSLSDSTATPDGFGLYAGLILIAILAGGALTTLGVKARPVVTFFKGLNETLARLVNVLFIIAPVGILFVVGSAVATQQPDFGAVLSVAGKYPVAVALALLVYVVIPLPILLKLMGQRDVFPYFGNLAPAIVTAFGTASSTSALPFT